MSQCKVGSDELNGSQNVTLPAIDEDYGEECDGWMCVTEQVLFIISIIEQLSTLYPRFV